MTKLFVLFFEQHLCAKTPAAVAATIYFGFRSFAGQLMFANANLPPDN
jgi:hypothetical protein